MGFPPRLITILALVQIFFVGGGYLLIRVCMNIRLHVDGCEWSPFPTIPGIFGTYGLWFLLVPVCCFAAAVRFNATDTPGSLSELQVLVNVAVASIVVLGFFVATASAVVHTFFPHYD